MDNIILYLKESYNELINKVSWPSMVDLLGATKIVIIGSIIFTLIVLVMSFASDTVTSFFYDLNS